jgi:hypothetical protein
MTLDSVPTDLMFCVFSMLTWFDVDRLCKTGKKYLGMKDARSYLHEIEFSSSRERRPIQRLISLHTNTLQSLSFSYISYSKMIQVKSLPLGLKKISIDNTLMTVDWYTVPNIEEVKLLHHTGTSLSGIENLSQLKILSVDTSDKSKTMDRDISLLPKLEYVFVNSPFSGENRYHFVSPTLVVLSVDFGYPIMTSDDANLIFFDDGYDSTKDMTNSEIHQLLYPIMMLKCK